MPRLDGQTPHPARAGPAFNSSKPETFCLKVILFLISSFSPSEKLISFLRCTQRKLHRRKPAAMLIKLFCSYRIPARGNPFHNLRLPDQVPLRLGGHGVRDCPCLRRVDGRPGTGFPYFIMLSYKRTARQSGPSGIGGVEATDPNQSSGRFLMCG